MLRCPDVMKFEKRFWCKSRVAAGLELLISELTGGSWENDFGTRSQCLAGSDHAGKEEGGHISEFIRSGRRETERGGENYSSCETRNLSTHREIAYPVRVRSCKPHKSGTHQGNQYVAQANKKTENQGKDKSAHTCSAEAKTKEGEQVADHIEGIDKYA